MQTKLWKRFGPKLTVKSPSFNTSVFFVSEHLPKVHCEGYKTTTKDLNWSPWTRILIFKKKNNTFFATQYLMHTDYQKWQGPTKAPLK